MREISDKELLDLQLEMMQKIHQFCQSEGITYFLFAGTLIGAIRHKGYIPWDDDIDIAMPRKDYERFINTFNGKCPDLRVLSPELNINYYAPFANVYDTRTMLDEGHNGHRGIELGVKIDIFPLDYVPSDLDEYRKLKRRIHKVNMLMYMKRYQYNGFRFTKDNFKLLAYKVILALVPYSCFQKYIGRLSQSSHEQEYMDDIIFNSYSRDCRVRKECYDSSISMQFENCKFEVPVGYDDVLKANFGEYMKLPPEDKRVPHHGFKAYWKY